MSLKPRSLSSLDSVKLFDEGCVKTRREEVIRLRMVELEFEDQRKAREEHFKQELKAKKPLPQPQRRELSQGEKHDRYFEEASKLADEIIEEERHIFVKSKEAWLLCELKRTKNSLKIWMLLVDEEGNIVKPTFISRVIDSSWGISREIYADVFGQKDPDRITIVNSWKRQLENVAYLIPYSSDEIKALYAEINELATPDHFEVWRNNLVVQVYGGKYAKDDEGLEGEKWVEKVAKRAKDLMAEKAKKAKAEEEIPNVRKRHAEEEAEIKEKSKKAEE